MVYKISVYGLSDVGLVRPNNEDFWTHLSDDQFFVLADGMGGHRAGEVASREASFRLCHVFKEKLAASSSKSLEAICHLLSEAIQDVNYSIYRMGCEIAELRGMGTTLCCVFLHPQGVIYAHVGDSRIYRLRQGRLEQLTHDHSLMRELMDLGQLSEQQIDDFAYKNILTKAVGTEPIVEPAIEHESIEVGDMILMCTDGLTDMLTHQEIEHIMAHTSEPEIAKKLVKTAKKKGGHDNITVVVVKIQSYEPTDLS